MSQDSLTSSLSSASTLPLTPPQTTPLSLPEQIDAPRLLTRPDFYCLGPNYQYKQLNYSIGYLNHAVSVDSSTRSVTLTYYTVSDHPTDGSKCRYTRKTRTESLLNTMDYMAKSGNYSAKVIDYCQRSEKYIASLANTLAMALNHEYHFSINDYRVEDENIRILLNAPYVPNDEMAEIPQMLIDAALYQELNLQSYVFYLTSPCSDPVVYIYEPVTHMNLPLTVFIGGRRKQLVTLKVATRALDFTLANLLVIPIPEKPLTPPPQPTQQQQQQVPTSRPKKYKKKDKTSLKSTPPLLVTSPTTATEGNDKLNVLSDVVSRNSNEKEHIIFADWPVNNIEQIPSNVSPAELASVITEMQNRKRKHSEESKELDNNNNDAAWEKQFQTKRKKAGIDYYPDKAIDEWNEHEETGRWIAKFIDPKSKQYQERAITYRNAEDYMKGFSVILQAGSVRNLFV